jgi:hypothetical protein
VLLLGYPAVLVAIAVTAVLLGLTAASGSLFIASAGNAALDFELAQLRPDAAGVTLSTLGRGGDGVFERADEQVRAYAAARIPELGEPTAMLLTTPLRAVATTPGGEERLVTLRVLARTGAFGNLDIVEGDPGGAGVSVPARLVSLLGAEPGGTITLDIGGRRSEHAVSAVHRDLAPPAGGLLTSAPPLDEYWRPLAGMILARETATGPEAPPPLLVADHAVVQQIAGGMQFGSNASWSFPLAASGLTLDDARRLAGRYRAFERAMRNPEHDLGRAVGDLTVFTTQLGAHSSLEAAVGRIDEAVTGLSPPVQTLSLAGVAVALVVLGAAGAFRTRRRRSEHTLLTVQGIGPLGQAVRAVVETAMTIVVGSLAGWQLGVVLVRALGPSSRIGGDVTATTLRHVLLAAAAGILALGVVTFRGVVRDSRVEASRLRQVASRTPWEVAVLSLTAAAYYQLGLRESALVGDGAEAQVDVLLLLFPLLFLAGLTGLAVRVLRRLLPSMRRWGTSLRTAPYLAVRRLTGASATAMLLVTASAMSLGTLVYGGVLASSAEASASAKAQVVIGADVTAPLPRGVDGFAPMLGQATVVARGDGQLLPGEDRVDILAVDTSTFASVVRWDPRFAEAPLEELLAGIERTGGARVPVLVAGIPPGDDLTLRAPRFAFPVTITGTAEAFPTMSNTRPVVVMDYRVFLDAFAEIAPASDATRVLATELWARGEPERLVGFLEAQGIGAAEVSTIAEVRDRPSMRSIGWALDYLQALGVLAGVLALAATLLYLQERQQAREVSYALASRMGLDRAAHRNAVALELAGMLVTALAVGGTLALAAARLVIPSLDPLPDVPPPPEMALPGAMLLTVALAVGLVCWAGAWMIQGVADRARVGEVLRVAE